MDASKRYSTEVFEIIDESTQKYSSTAVSGGGGANGYTADVKSVTTYHSDQDIWVKNIDTGKERKLSFNGTNINVRPGHRIICVWDDETDKLERVMNISTDELFYPSQCIYNRERGIVNTFSNPMKLYFNGILNGLIYTIIFPATLLFSIIMLVRGGSYNQETLKYGKARTLGFSMLLGSSLIIYFTTHLLNEMDGISGLGLSFIIGIWFFLVTSWQIFLNSYEFKTLKKNGDAIDLLTKRVAENYETKEVNGYSIAQ